MSRTILQQFLLQTSVFAVYVGGADQRGKTQILVPRTVREMLRFD